jgi:hypothetical protein
VDGKFFNFERACNVHILLYHLYFVLSFQKNYFTVSAYFAYLIVQLLFFISFSFLFTGLTTDGMKLMNKNAIFKIILLAKKESVSLNEVETVILGGDSSVLSLPKIESTLVGAAVLLLVREKGSDVMPLYVMCCFAFFFFYHPHPNR